MNEIKYCPSTLRGGYATYSPQALRTLFSGKRVDHVLDFDIDEFRTVTELEDAMHRISVSGVQEKFPAIIHDGRIRVSRSDERSTHILKPAPWDQTLALRKLIPANEHLTMQIAAQVYGLITAENGLCFTPRGQMVYITRRFDIMPDGSKIAMEDLASVIGRNEQNDGLYFKYTGCYEEIAVAIRRHVAAWMVDMERFFDLVLFNYTYANGDAHLKNFSLIKQGDDLRLAPAYDLINTSLHVDGGDFGLDGGLSPNIEKSNIYDRTNHPCRLDFERFGLRIGLNKQRVASVLDKYMSIPQETKSLIEHSFLTDKAKRSYLRIVKERISRFIRESE